jgi:aromatic ring-cleaving dioxygenase
MTFSVALRNFFVLLSLLNAHAWISSSPLSLARVPLCLLATNDEDSLKTSSNLNYALKKRNPYDVHVYYETHEQFHQSLKLREKMQSMFSWMRFYSPKSVPIGPHPLPMWEADFGAYENRDKLGDVCQFLQEHHGQLSVMIHPHSTDGDYADHTKHIIWFGPALDLRLQGWQGK